MTSERWSQIKQVFQTAAAREGQARVAYLESACGGDEDLRQEVESLLESSSGQSPLDSPVRFADLTGRTIGHYRVLERLGHGGMGVVYKAEDTKLGRTVALKFLAPHVSWSEDHRVRFLKEAKALAAIDHPNICPVYSIEESDGQPFLAMAFIDGPTLKDRIAEGPLGMNEAIRIVSGAAWGLEAAHRNGVVHRDVKSANILLNPDGRALLTDFGLAHQERDEAASQSGLLMGTPAYMSPEQVRGENADRRSDIWSLGVVLYEALTGAVPFREEPSSILKAGPAPVSTLRADVPPEIDRIIARALAKPPAERHQSAAALARELEALRPIAPVKKDAPAARGGRWKLVLAGFGLAVAVFAGMIGFLYWRAGWTGQTDLRESVAVFPLKDLSGDGSQQYFTDGMTDAITTDLARIGALRVVSRTTSQSYMGRQDPIREIFRDFHVHYVVEGSVLRAGDRVRINVRLVETKPDRNAWAQSYEGDLRDVLLLQSNVAQAIAEEVRVRLTPGERAQLGNKAKVNPKSYELFLRGRHLTMKWARDDIIKGREYFRQAIAEDPNDALAYAGMADTFITEGFYWGVRPLEHAAEARRWASEAIRIDPSLGGPHRVLALVHGAYGKDWAEARKEFDRAHELDPGSEWAHYTFASYYLIPLGRFDEALREVQAAREIAPLSPNIATMAGWVHFFRREYDQAAGQFRRTLELEPAFSYARQGLASSLALLGRSREALEASDHTETTAWIHALAGNRAEARTLLAKLVERSKSEYVGGYEFAFIHTALGEKLQAMDQLERSYRDQQPQLANVNIDPRFDALRSEPRFVALTRKLNLIH